MVGFRNIIQENGCFSQMFGFFGRVNRKRAAHIRCNPLLVSPVRESVEFLNSPTRGISYFTVIRK